MAAWGASEDVGRMAEDFEELGAEMVEPELRAVAVNRLQRGKDRNRKLLVLRHRRPGGGGDQRENDGAVCRRSTRQKMW